MLPWPHLLWPDPARRRAGRLTAVDTHIEIVRSETIATIAPEIYSHLSSNSAAWSTTAVGLATGQDPQPNGIRLDFIKTM